MAEKSKKSKSSRKKGKKAPFMDFNKRNFSKAAQNYHHEVQHIIADLIQITRRLNKSAVLCQFFIDSISRRKGITPKYTLEYFEDAIYHLENHAFRASAFRDKLLQFTNLALQLGYDEREREAWFKN